MKKTIAFILLITAVKVASFSECFCSNRSHMKIELNDNWHFRQVGWEEWLPAQVPGTIHTDLLLNGRIGDPFYRTNERDQQWIDKVDWEYRTIFDLEKEMLQQENIQLIFDGLDTYVDVYLNGSKIHIADNMFRQWRVDCKSLLKRAGNELKLYFHSPVKVDLPKLAALGYQLPAVNDQSENGGLGDKKISVFARKAGYHYGWDWGPRFVTSGIWRPIHLLGWNKAQIDNIQIVQKGVTSELAEISAVFEIESTSDQEMLLSIQLKDHPQIFVQRLVKLNQGMNRLSLDFRIDHPKLWWCNGLGEPHLYYLEAQLRRGHSVLDAQVVRFGVRTLKLIQQPDQWGKSFYFELNGVPVFAKGANYIPNDNFLPRVTRERYEQVVKAAAQANMNMLRVWGGGIYENDIFYDLCDQYGIMVWQDFMFACAMYPGDEEFLESVKAEAIDNVKRLRNHPCLALWCGNNEIDVAWSHDTPGGWGWKERFSEPLRRKLWNDYETIFHRLLPQVVAEYDPKTFYWPSSPLADWNQRASYESTSGDVHYWGVWHGREPFENFKIRIGRFMSEYGFQSFPEFKTIQSYAQPADWDLSSEVMMAHQRSGIGNQRIKEYMDLYYRNPKDFQSLLYVSQVLQAEAIKSAIEAHRSKAPFCMGSLYWQLNDCWPVASWSSIDYFGRWKALHYFARKAYQEILVVPTTENGKLQVKVVSDRLQPLQANLRMEIIRFDGEKLWETSQPMIVQYNSAQICFEANLDELLKGMDRRRIVLRAHVHTEDRLIAENLLYFLPPKELELPKASISIDVSETSDGYRIDLSTDALAKSIYLSIDEIDGLFSDNYFDLLPKQKATVFFYCGQKTADFGRKLKIMTLCDSY
ncbi:MAG: glycoside hydrolase family 2 protein [candidate division KSB1 bacterium]|nr:glycoside hydrolase family 2 protein [candidate division KSB1 bacterium]